MGKTDELKDVETLDPAIRQALMNLESSESGINPYTSHGGSRETPISMLPKSRSRTKKNTEDAARGVYHHVAFSAAQWERIWAAMTFTRLSGAPVRSAGDFIAQMVETGWRKSYPDAYKLYSKLSLDGDL